MEFLFWNQLASLESFIVLVSIALIGALFLYDGYLYAARLLGVLTPRKKYVHEKNIEEAEWIPLEAIPIQSEILWEAKTHLTLAPPSIEMDREISDIPTFNESLDILESPESSEIESVSDGERILAIESEPGIYTEDIPWEDTQVPIVYGDEHTGDDIDTSDQWSDLIPVTESMITPDIAMEIEWVAVSMNITGDGDLPVEAIWEIPAIPEVWEITAIWDIPSIPDVPESSQEVLPLLPALEHIEPTVYTKPNRPSHHVQVLEQEVPKKTTHTLSPEKREKLVEITQNTRTLIARWQLVEARTLIIEWLSLSKDHRELNILLAELYEREHRFEKAEYIYKDLAHIYIDDADILLHLANSLAMQRKYRVSYELYKKVLTLQWDSEDVLYTLTHLASELIEVDDTYEYARNYIRQYPKNPEILWLYSQSQITRGNRRDAIETLIKLKNLTPYNQEIIDLIQKLVVEEEMAGNFGGEK